MMTKRKGHRPSAVIAGRLVEFRRRMKGCRADGFLLSNDVDYFYLTGFTGNESAVIVTRRDVHILSDGRFTEEIKHEVPWAKAWLRKGMLNDEIVRACRELKIKKLAVQAGHFTVGDHAELKKRNKSTKLILAPPALSGMRKIKTPTDLSAMNKAMRIAEEAFVATCKTIRVGQTELQMAARLEYEMKTRGAQAPAFPTICAEGANAAVPHARPGVRKVKKGSAILFDWGARCGGYCSDLTRMAFAGRIPPKIAEIYGIVLDAQLAGIAAVRPGRRMCDVDAVARKIITDAGYGAEFTHGLGHGLGLDVHEPPSLSWRSKEELEAGMVVTVEPGIYLPGVGGVRIEDDVLVTRTGRRVLTKLGKTLNEAIVSV